jgi:hypothetical protein
MSTGGYATDSSRDRYFPQKLPKNVDTAEGPTPPVMDTFHNTYLKE